ncbi:MAG: hypothetical protein GX591_10115 [Planctomycetes bacterium]|nr:hypothetical protein [Planctomycetota bacterium]
MAATASGAPAVVQIVNGDFEANGLHDGWRLYVVGAQPSITRDGSIRRTGRCSLRIAAAADSDTALGQVVTLQPGHLYRLTGWVRTAGLVVTDAKVYGALRVATPDGQTTIAQGPNHEGNTEWTHDTVIFRAPSDGTAQIAVFFAGFGKGRGVAWFDGIHLEELRSANAAIRVEARALTNAPINPFQYGQFIEPCHDCVDGLWAEKLCDTSFEGIAPYTLAFREATDPRERPWYPIGAVNRGRFTLDESNPLNGSRSQRIEAQGVEPCTIGIAQDGVAVTADEPCKLSVYLRRSDQPLRVRAYLRDGGQILAQTTFEPGMTWEKYTAQLTPTAASAGARLCLEFRGPGTVWVDQISLMPENAVGGWRADVVEALRALRPGIIRWGGIAVEHYNWRNLIGDPDQRVPWRETVWNSIHPAASGLEEFIALCRAVDAEPMICVRVTGVEATEAAAQVEYFNGAADTPMGRLRARNGHREPYGVKYWQVGNEQGGLEYAARLPAFCRAMRQADPSITLLSSYPSEDVLQQAGAHLDHICPHHYSDLPGREASFDDLRRLLARHPRGPAIKVAVTEWNTTATDWGLQRHALWTLDNALACAIYHNILHGNADLVEITTRSDLINSHCAGAIQTRPDGLFTTPAYHAQWLYANYAGRRPLITALAGDLPSTHVSATLSADGREVVLFVVNTLPMACDATIDLTAFGRLVGDVEVWTLVDTEDAGERDVSNSFDEPDRVRPVASAHSVGSSRFQYTFPRLSLTVLKCRTEKKLP